MNHTMILEIASGVVGGLFIFLLGMKNLSEGMQAIAGHRLRKMVAAVTDNRVAACATGATVTALIQSSSVTTVMVVGMVNAGVMTLLQAVGVILGADIGTTITAWIVALKVTHYGLPLLGVAGFFFLFAKSERVRYTAMMVMGIGMIFFGLQLMKHGLEPLRETESFIALFSRFRPHNVFGVLRCVMIGAFVTAVVQSSSATVAITITLAYTGAIDYDTAVALVLGENIGTTVTAYLASLGASTNAKRVAWAHILMKITAVAIMVPLFFPYMRLLTTITSENMDIAKRIAVSHTLFNVMLVFLFLPLRTVIAKLLCKIIPDKAHEEVPHLTFLDVRMLGTPAISIQQSSEEVRRMGESVQEMCDWLGESIADKTRNDEREKMIFHREKVLDITQKEIVEFLSSLLAGTVPHEVVDEARWQLRVADEYESISDYLVSILKLDLRRRSSGLEIADQDMQSLLALHAKVSEYIQMISQAVTAHNPDILSKAVSHGKSVTHMMKEARTAHLDRVTKQHVSPLCCLIYIDMLSSYRKIKDHGLNIAEAIAGEK